jgi:hypothetical protein
MCFHMQINVLYNLIWILGSYCEQIVFEDTFIFAVKFSARLWMLCTSVCVCVCVIWMGIC